MPATLRSPMPSVIMIRGGLLTRTCNCTKCKENKYLLHEGLDLFFNKSYPKMSIFDQLLLC